MRCAIALGGFMGCGKSTVGRALAARLGWPFLDTDALLSSRHGPIPVQIRGEGELVFRAREVALIAELSEPSSGQVVATGGGAWVDPANRAALRRRHGLVVLHAPLEVLASRVAGGEGRPLWDASVRARYAARQAAYADADLHLDATRGPEELVEEIVAWWLMSGMEAGATAS